MSEIGIKVTTEEKEKVNNERSNESDSEVEDGSNVPPMASRMKTRARTRSTHNNDGSGGRTAVTGSGRRSTKPVLYDPETGNGAFTAAGVN